MTQEVNVSDPGLYMCGGVVSSLKRGEPVKEVGLLTCPPACQGRPSCLSMCCPRGQWFTGASCQPERNETTLRSQLEAEDYNIEWSGYYSGYYLCDHERFTQVQTVSPVSRA